MKRGFKNYSIIICSMVILLSSCSTSKEMRQMNRKVNGNWVLQTIITEGTEARPKDKIFNEADFSCFIGSEWKFKRKSKGIYTIVDKQKNCPAISRMISWSFAETNGTPETIVLKRLDDKNNSMDGDAGFSLVVIQLDDKLMKLKATAMIDGHSAAIVYNFVKQ